MVRLKHRGRIRGSVFLATLVTCIFILGYSSLTIASSNLPKSLWFGTNPPGSLYYILGGGMAKVLSEHTPMEVKVKALGGPAEWMALMGQNEVDLALVNAGAGRLGYEGKREFEEATKGKGYRFMRTIVAGGPLLLGVVAAGDANIKEMADLKGKKVAYPYKVHTVNNNFLEAMLASAGITPKDLKQVPITTYPAGVRAVVNRRADAALGSVGSGVIKELNAARGAHFVSIVGTPEGRRRMQEIEPAATLMYPSSLGGKTGCMGLSNLVLARESISDDVVYIITKVLWEHYKELVPIHPSFMSWDNKNFVRPEGVSLPYHRGAIRFYKEKGVWTPEMDKLQQRLLGK